MSTASRSEQLGAFYASHHRSLQRLVAHQVRAPGTILEDACQSAWAALCAHPEVELSEHTALRWLVTTSTREAWRRSRRVSDREAPAGQLLAPDEALAPGELAEPVAESPGPLERALAHERYHERLEQLRALSERERLHLYLHGLGHNYREIAELTGASTRTVERQILRARRKLKHALADRGG